MATHGVRAEEREVLLITFTNLFIRHELKSWNWVEVLSKLMLPLAVLSSLILRCRPHLSAPVLPSLFLLPTILSIRGIMGCLEKLQGEREENSCYVTLRREKAEETSLKDCPETKELWNSLSSGNAGKILIWKFISNKDVCSPNCFGILKTFSIHPSVGV